MKTNLTERYLKRSSASRDIIIVAGISVVFILLQIFFDVIDLFMEWAHQHEPWHVHEVITLSVLLTAAFGVLFLRRWMELRKEITERKQAEEALRDSEKFSNTLLSNSPIGAYIVQDKKLQYVNPMFQELTGFSEGELLDINPLQLVLPEDKDSTNASATAMLKGKRTQPYEYRVFNKGGGVRHIMGTVTSIQHQGRRAVLGNYMDITERKQAEEALRERENFSNSLLSNSPHPILVINPDSSIAYVNPALERLTGFTAAEIVGQKAPYPWWLEEEPVKTTSLLKKAMRHGQEHAERSFKKKNGDIFWVEITAAPLVSLGDYGYYVANWVDITERKRVEEALREREENFRALAEDSSDGISISNYEGEIGKRVYCNQGLAKLTGYSVEEILRLPLMELVHPDDRARATEIRRKRVRRDSAPKRYETTLITREGDAVPVEVTISETAWQGQPAIMVVYRDITERKKAEEALRESEEKYRSIFAQAPVSIMLLDRDGQIIDVNPYHVTEIGKGKTTPADYIGKNMITFPPVVRAGLSAKYRRLVSKGEPINLEGVYFPITMGGVQRYMNVKGIPLFSDGKLSGAIVMQEDITERKHAEKAQEEVDRLKSEFVSNVSHELRSPLHSIKGFTELMLDGKVPDPAMQKEFLSIIDEQSQHLNSLIDNLLDMSRLEAGQFSIEKGLTSIQDIIHAAVDGFYGLSTEKGVPITEVIPSTLPDIEADARRIKQVMFNLLSNAIKFSDPGSPVTVKAEAKDGKLLIRVIDRGPGIPREALPHLFSRFHQAGRASEIGGTGLGLHISKQIIEAHGGCIWTKTKLGQGSTFSFTLPLGHKGGDPDE